MTSPEIIAMDSPARFINRELSWLAFNFRVLEEASNPTHPLLERLRFVTISASNLDEFFMVRVAGLKGQVTAGIQLISDDGLSPSEQLEAITDQARELQQDQQDCLRHVLIELRDKGISLLKPDELTQRENIWLEGWFLEQIFPALTPLAVDSAHPFPFIPNKGLMMVLELNRASDDKNIRGLIPIPHNLDRFIRLPGKEVRFISHEDVVGMYLARLFPGFEVTGRGMVRVIRDSDVEVDEEAEDLVMTFENMLRRRRRGHVIRLQVSADLPESLLDFTVKQTGADDRDIYELDGILGLSDVNHCRNRFSIFRSLNQGADNGGIIRCTIKRLFNRNNLWIGGCLA